MQMRDYVARCALRYPDETAYIHGTTHRTWREVHRRSDRLGAVLKARGVRQGDRVAVLSRNRIEIVEHWFACLKFGYVRVGVNWRYSTREILHVARDAGVKALLVDASCLAAFAASLEELRHQGVLLIGFGGVHDLPLDYESILAADALPVAYPLIEPSALAMIAYTSGTTGLPKGVMLSHRAVHESALHTALELGFRHDDVRAYVSNPSGINIFQVCFNMFTGMKTVLDDFETGRFLDMVAEHRISCVTLIPTMLARVIEAVQAGHHDVSSLRQIYYGSMPTTPALITSAYKTLDCTFVQGYGVSESCGPIAGLMDSDHRRALAGEPQLLRSIGKAFLHAEMSVRDEEGREVPLNATGTIWIRSETMMSGYLNLPEQTAEAIDGEWLRTGDIGAMDERGYVFLEDRKKHMIISGGMNIYPTSVENALAEHPGVREAVVVGVPHPSWGEAVVAVVSLKPDARATGAELIAHCEGRIPRWELPKHVRIVAALPQGNTDKLNKRQVLYDVVASGELPWTVPQ